jgi:hypothetical protein
VPPSLRKRHHDDELVAGLLQELIEIISLFGVQDADALCERVLTDLSGP